MANTLLTTDMITNKSLAVLENKLVIVRNCNRQYDNSFAVSGAKIGATLRIRKPSRFTVSSGAALAVQADNEQYGTLTVSNQAQIAVSFTSDELALQMDDFSGRIIEPAMSQLAAYIDNDVANAYKTIWQSVGTPGTTPATSAVLLAGQQKLDEAAAGEDGRFLAVTPAANAALVEGLKGLFNPGDTISRQFKSGLMGTGVLRYEEISMTQSLNSLTTGTRTTATVTTTVATQGQATLALTTAGASDTIKAGEVFTVASVFAVNPQTRLSTGSLQQFVVTADATASGSAVTVTVQPMYTATQQLANIDAFPVATAAVTFMGSGSTVYPQNLIFQKDAITFATADLVLPKGTDMASRQVANGISIRFVQDYNIQNDQMIGRFDVLYGYSVIRPEQACRLWG